MLVAHEEPKFIWAKINGSDDGLVGLEHYKSMKTSDIIIFYCLKRKKIPQIPIHLLIIISKVIYREASVIKRKKSFSFCFFIVYH